MQRAQRLAEPAMVVGAFRLPHRVVAIEMRPGFYRRIDFADTRKTIGHQFGGGDPALANIGGRLAEGQRSQAHR